MLHYVAPLEKAPEPAVIFAKVGCPHCARAKEILRANGVVFEEVTLGKSITSSTLRAVSGKGTAPQVFIGGRLIGGADELERHFAGNRRKAA
jgi:glutaredoxin-like protein